MKEILSWLIGHAEATEFCADPGGTESHGCIECKYHGEHAPDCRFPGMLERAKQLLKQMP